MKPNFCDEIVRDNFPKNIHEVKGDKLRSDKGNDKEGTFKKGLAVISSSLSLSHAQALPPIFLYKKGDKMGIERGE